MLARKPATVQKLKSKDVLLRNNERRLRVVCVSGMKCIKVRYFALPLDTHNRLSKILDKIPAGDVFIHAGDFTMYGTPKEVVDFRCLSLREVLQTNDTFAVLC